MFFKILNNLVKLHLPNYINPNISITRDHESKFSVLYTRIDAYKYSFFQPLFQYGTIYLLKP